MWLAVIISCGATATGTGCDAYTVPRWYTSRYTCENALARTYPEVMETRPIWVHMECMAVVSSVG